MTEFGACRSNSGDEYRLQVNDSTAAGQSNATLKSSRKRSFGAYATLTVTGIALGSGSLLAQAARAA